MRTIGVLLVVALIAGASPGSAAAQGSIQQPVYSREFPPCRHC